MSYNKEKSELLVKEKIENSNNNCLPRNISSNSTCSISFMRTNDNLKSFFATNNNKHPFNYKYSDIKELESACNDFILLCLNNALYPTMELLACYLNVSSDWLTRVVNNENDSRCTTIKKVRDIIKAILTQHTLTKEGNPAGNIFHLKSTFGMSENNILTLQSNIQNSYNYLSSEEKDDILTALEETK